MRLSTTTLAATLFALLSAPGISHAATSPEAIAKVLSDCPMEARVGTCGNAVVDFANGLPRSAERNDDLLALAQALAEEGQGAKLSPFVCLELERGIRLAGQAAAGAKVQGEITAIADALCADDLDYTATGSTRAGGTATGGGWPGHGGPLPDDGYGPKDPFAPHDSIIEQPDPDDSPDNPPSDTPPSPPPAPEPEPEPEDLLPPIHIE